jgi:protein-S-isoprenylcysteine O-methyltransferase Ste14
MIGQYPMQSIASFLFILAVTFEFIYLILFILTIKLPGFRFWPPPSPRSWEFFTAWMTAALVAVIFLLLGLLDFDSSILHNWIRIPISLGLFFISFAFGIWAFLTLGFRTTMGLGDRLITDGPYRYSRNPQYIVDSFHILLYMILTNSWMVSVIGILGVALNLLAPFTEEPWLEEKFGSEYLEYKQRVPRFVSFPKMDLSR